MYALKSIQEDGTTRNRFQWPDKGPVEELSALNLENTGPCPSRHGDGLCLGKSFAGMAQGWIPTRHILTVRYRKEDVLGEDSQKLRVSRCVVVKRWTALEWINAHPHQRSYLQGAYLRDAQLKG